MGLSWSKPGWDPANTNCVHTDLGLQFSPQHTGLSTVEEQTHTTVLCLRFSVLLEFDFWQLWKKITIHQLWFFSFYRNGFLLFCVWFILWLRFNKISIITIQWFACNYSFKMQKQQNKCSHELNSIGSGMKNEFWRYCQAKGLVSSDGLDMPSREGCWWWKCQGGGFETDKKGGI